MPVNARTLPDAIQWHEGMLLAPQHFQQLSLRYEALLHYHASTLSPYFWGIRTFSYDKVILANGTFRILELEGLMPDGLLATFDSESDGDLQIDLREHLEELKRGPLTIHLAVPTHSSVSGGERQGEVERYTSIESNVTDESTGEGRVMIPRLRPRLSLLATELPPSRFVSFPLVRVEFRDQMFHLGDFLSPSLSVGLRSPLGELCTEIALRLREKALYLSDEVKTRFYVLGASGVLDHKAKIQSLVEALPYFESILNTGQSHPYNLYTALCLIAGHVAALGRSLVPPTFPPYNHNSLRSSFTVVRDYIFSMIDEGIWESYFAIAFTYQNDLFNLVFEEAWLRSPMLIGVRGIEGASEREVLQWVDEALLGSESKIQSLRERRILGVARQRREEDDIYVAARGLLLFTIANDRENIVPGEILQVINRGDSTSIVSEIFLFVQKERKT